MWVTKDMISLQITREAGNQELAWGGSLLSEVGLFSARIAQECLVAAIILMLARKNSTILLSIVGSVADSFVFPVHYVRVTRIKNCFLNLIC